MTRPDDAAVRVRVETFAHIRRLLPVAILAGTLVVPVFVLEPAVGVPVSIGLFFGCLFVGWTIRDLPLYPAHTFGLEYRTEDESLESARRRCVRCETAFEDGVRRRYARQLVALGVPLYTLAWGQNDFCADCLETDAAADGEAGADGRQPATSGAEPARRVVPDETTALEVRRAFDD